MSNNDNFLMTTPEEVTFIRKQLGTSEEDIQEAIRTLREWLAKQPHLPNNVDDCRIERMYINCKCRIERVKVGLDAYFSLKHRYPELLMERDILHPDIQFTAENTKMVTMPRLMKDGSRVHVNMGYSTDPETIRLMALLKLTLMEVELLQMEDYSLGDVCIVDLGPAHVGHLAKLDLNLLRALENCYRTAYCRRLKALHLVNSPKLVQVMANIIKVVFPVKLQERIQVHLPGTTTLFDHVPPEFVPDELGGTAGSIDNFNHMVYKRLFHYRDWFLEQDKYASDESKRPSPRIEPEPLVGSFRKLSVD